MEALQEQINQLIEAFNSLTAASTIPNDVEQAFRIRLRNILSSLPTGLQSAPLAAVTSPSGGATIDAQARIAIDAIITRLEDLGLINPN